LLTGDLARSGLDLPDPPHAPDSLPVPGRSSASWTPTASGQNQKPCTSPLPSAAHATPLLPGGRRSLACRRSGAKRQPNLEIRFPLTLLCRLMLGPLRAPSRTSRAPTACGQNQSACEQVRSYRSCVVLAISLLSTRGSCPGNRFCRRRRSPACRRSGAKRQPNLKIRFPLNLLGRMINGLRPESKPLANKFAPTGPVSFSRSASVNARELSGKSLLPKA